MHAPEFQLWTPVGTGSTRIYLGTGSARIYVHLRFEIQFELPLLKLNSKPRQKYCISTLGLGRKEMEPSSWKGNLWSFEDYTHLSEPELFFLIESTQHISTLGFS